MAGDRSRSPACVAVGYACYDRSCSAVLVNVKCYGALGVILGSYRVLELPDGARVEDLLFVLEQELARRSPGTSDLMAGGKPGVIVLIKNEPVSVAANLHDGDEVALVLPMGGG